MWGDTTDKLNDKVENSCLDGKPLSYAERILKKHGWKSGDGLGKNAQGISEPIKANLKFDKTGIGHDQAKEFTSHWWDDAYKKAVDNVIVNNEKDGTVRIDWKKQSKDEKKKRKQNLINSRYTAFVQSATLENGTEDCHEEQPKMGNDGVPIPQKSLTDEELFAACGGLTAHKGARHGHKMSAKQKRLEMQEQELMLHMKKTYKLDQIDHSKNSSTLKSKTVINTGEMNIKSKEDNKLKKHKHKKHKQGKREKCNSADIVEATQSNTLPTTIYAASEPTDCKENIGILNRTKKLKNKTNLKSDIPCDNVPTDKTTSNRKAKKAKKKRKPDETDDCLLSCDKKRNKKM